MKQQRQTTLRTPVVLSGVGVHSGADVKIVLHPAEADHGIVFLRTGLADGRDRLIDARHLAVTATELCTVIGEAESGAVATIEHLMSAFYGLGVDNALVEIDGPEVPILDGSAAPFVEAIDRAGSSQSMRSGATSRSSRPSGSPAARPSPSCGPTSAASGSTSRSISPTP